MRIDGTMRQGVSQALLAAALFGVSAPLLKGLVQPTAPQLLAGLLYLGSGVGLGTFWLMARSRRATTERSLTRNDLPWLAGAIVAGGMIAPVLLMFGIARTAASGASLLLNLEGVFTALLAWFVFKENFDRRIAVGMIAIVAGAALLSWQGEVRVDGVTGPMLIVGACFAWGIDNNLSQKVSASDPVQTTALKGIVAGLVNVLIAIAIGARGPGLWNVGAAMILGFVSYGLSLVLYIRALRVLGTARTGAYFASAPFIGAVLSLVLWHDPVTVPLIAAGALMAAGVWLHAAERHEHEHAHGFVAHDHAHLHDDHHQHVHGVGDPPVTDPIPHRHSHDHQPLVHSHRHYPDIHHRHGHQHKDDET